MTPKKYTTETEDLGQNMRFDIMTVFPDMIKSAVGDSILGNAAEKGIIDVKLHDIRDYTKDKHRKTDDYPFGGGRGMVMTVQPVLDCHRAVCEGERVHTVYMSPQGSVLTQKKAEELSKLPRLCILCGHYEGVDERIIESIVDEEISVGDYVLTGGELPAAILVDCISRLIPGVLPDSECYEIESISSGLLEYPQYTRPASFDGMDVPEVLLSGHHENIKKWRRRKALEKTFAVRPEMIETLRTDGKLSFDDENVIRVCRGEEPIEKPSKRRRKKKAADSNADEKEGKPENES